ncbi:MAG TPA: Kae1-associated serine/threonine protein kinase [Nanoarchaeota archaeon]|nr:MAG: Mn2+-dependent serine/threonine protein kinase [archaeon GW2011_AR6]HIH17660.1 Kae1-associated serine/threonine protein kinase [Nanoarchaeota archaeon]HIH34399.1 Kae1-associated serine/threonine protein kinase [Nanoarchaeota archaeon]HIH51706.1 Kae1-associated serine/threonine protein kinase [Nanoarchaeota archaeon]HIH66724.1 Kae1-associated serine/threonine protein kinase [Nanoarchaeota archaeon]
MPQKQKILARGAEAILIHQGTHLLKRRVQKRYRHPALDAQLRTRRTKLESRILEKASNLVAVPKVLHVREHEIEMEFIPGKVLSEALDSLTPKVQEEVAKNLGADVARLHSSNIIHGDLTTSNLICTFFGKESAPRKLNKIFFIDFGLGFHSERIEDRAVDLHLLREALKSKHFRIAEKFFASFAKEYTKSYKRGKEVLARMHEVESRGRYKEKGML